jgi:hypothetical protein
MAYTRTTPAWHDFPSTDTSIDAADLENWERGLLGTNNDLVVLFWNGTTYLPKNGDTTTKADTSKARLFVGPVDPGTVTGVVLVDGDRWDQYT